jgi:hypothetical protein
MHFLSELHSHLSQLLPEAREVRYVSVPHTFRRRATGGILPDNVPGALRASGHARLRIVCLWDSDWTRQRMRTAICQAFGHDPDTLIAVDGADTPLLQQAEQAVTVWFHRAPEALRHGPITGRAHEVAAIPALTAEDDTLIVALCETRYEDDQELPEADDAKHQLRRILASMGIPSQFIRWTPRPAGAAQPTRQRAAATARRRAKRDEDHPARAAVVDLLRSAGLVDARVGMALAHRHPAAQVCYVGVHVRLQATRGQARRGKQLPEKRLTITLTALRPTGGKHDPWELLAYHGPATTPATAAAATTAETGWVPYARALTRFHQHPIEAGTRTTEHLDKVARGIDIALGQLAERLDGQPYVVFVEAEACRGIWPGLANLRLGITPPPGELWLPGSTQPPARQPVAIVRVNPKADEIPQAVRAEAVDDQHTTRATTAALYRLEADGKHTAWLLVNVPPQFDGQPGLRRLGQSKTRWSAHEREIDKPWYAMTATELLPLVQAGWDAEAVVIAAARMCHQSTAWDGRTTRPAPLHLARNIDLDHPEYRRTLAHDDPHTAEDSEPAPNPPRS